MDDEPHDTADLAAWLELAEGAVRRHRQGRVLAVDPALVLRGLPPMWRPATAHAGPADDVVALAGVAVSHLGVDHPARDLLLEAAAGCRGSDLPALLRQVRPLLGTVVATPEAAGDAAPAADRRTGREAGAGAGDRRRQGGSAGPGVDGDQPGRPPGRRLGIAGAVAAGALAVFGGASAVTGGPSEPPTDLGAGPVTVADDRAVLRWDPPHLEVDVGDVRYRYRLAGDVDAVAWRDDPRRPTLVVRAGGSRWEVPVPVLDRLSGTAGPR